MGRLDACHEVPQPWVLPRHEFVGMLGLLCMRQQPPNSMKKPNLAQIPIVRRSTAGARGRRRAGALRATSGAVGSLATNKINSKALIGAETDPPGYVQPSIATIRLWRSH